MVSPFALRGASYLAAFGTLLLCERLAPFAPSGQRKSFRVLFHLGLSVANTLLLYLVMTGPLLAVLAYSREHGIGLARLLGLGGWPEFLATVVAFDLWDYWMHRANHRIRFLWRFHKAHHSDMEIDVTTASRFHAGELLISTGVKCLMILIWGPSLWGLVTFDILLTFASQFHHSNLAIPLPVQDRIERAIVTPRMHRCHHALHPDCYIANYSTVFSIWDRLFGSYHRARGRDEISEVGLRAPRGQVTMQLKPFLLTPLREE